MASFGQTSGVIGPFVSLLGFNSPFFWPGHPASQTLSFVLLAASSTNRSVRTWVNWNTAWAHTYLLSFGSVSRLVSHLDDIRDVSKALFQLWLSSHVPAMALRVNLDLRPQRLPRCVEFLILRLRLHMASSGRT